MRRAVRQAPGDGGGLRARTRRLVRSVLSLNNLGVVGVLVMFVALTSLYAMSDRRFFSDENAHTQYALTLSHGRLPTLHDRVERDLPGMVPTSVYTANHPPLYYAVIALPLRVGLATGHAGAGFYAARLCSVLLAVVAIALTVMLVRRLAPNRPVAAVMAAGTMATVPMFLGVSSTVFNDSMIVLTTVLGLVLTVRMVQDGGTGRRLGGVSLAALAACASRITGVVPAGVGVGGAAFAWWRRARGRRPAGRLAQAAAAAAAVGAVVAAGIGWFYLRNIALYGDLIGKDTNRSILNKHPADRRALEVLRDPDSWHLLLSTSYGRPGLIGTTLWVVIRVVVLCAALAVGWWLVRALVHRTRPSSTTLFSWLACWFVLLASFALLVYYNTEGGPPNPRYLLPGLPVVALLVGFGFGSLPRRVRGVASAFWLVVASLIAALLVGREVAYQYKLDLSDPWHAVAVGISRNSGFDRTNLLLGAWSAVFLTGLAAAVVALVVNGWREDRPSPSSAQALVVDEVPVPSGPMPAL